MGLTIEVRYVSDVSSERLRALISLLEPDDAEFLGGDDEQPRQSPQRQIEVTLKESGPRLWSGQVHILPVYKPVDERLLTPNEARFLEAPGGGSIFDKRKIVGARIEVRVLSGATRRQVAKRAYPVSASD